MKNKCHKAAVHGFFRFVHTRNGLVLKDVEIPNAIVIQGKNSLLNKFFRGVTPNNTTWDFGFIATPAPVLSANDTIQTHPGWTVATVTTPTTTTFTGGTNGFQPVASQSVSSVNSQPLGTPATITTAGTINGLFLCSTPNGGVLGSAGDVLWSTVALGATISVAIGDVVYITYTCTVGASSSGITNQGKDRLLDTNFLNNLYTWKMALFHGSIAVVGDTFASHPGWTDIGQAAITPTWEPAGNTVATDIYTDTSSGNAGALFQMSADYGPAPAAFTGQSNNSGNANVDVAGDPSHVSSPATSVNGAYLFDSTNTWLLGSATGSIGSGGLTMFNNEFLFIDYVFGIA